MRERRNAILLFSKPPVPGLVKTRLTPLKDGIFTPEVAAGLYHCMFFDVVEICCDALTELEAKQADVPETASGGTKPHETAPQSQQAELHESESSPLATDDPGSSKPETNGSESSESEPSSTGPFQPISNAAAAQPDVYDTYELFISTTPVENVDVMRKYFDDSGTWPRDITIISDVGASFDEHYNHAFRQVFEKGFDTILSMGGDMPALPRSVVVEGFERLHELCALPQGGIVISPDQEMGVSLVGWTRETPMDHTGVFYNAEGLTVLPAYLAKARAISLPALYLPAVVDVDTMADLAHNVTLVQAIKYCAQFQDISVPWRTIEALHEIGYEDVRVMPNELRDSREGIDV